MAKSRQTRPKPVGRPSWKIRRRVIFATLFFCALEVAYLTVWGRDTELSRTIVMGLIFLAFSTIGSYVFGAVWDDSNVMSNLRRGGSTDPYADHVDEEEETDKDLTE